MCTKPASKISLQERGVHYNKKFEVLVHPNWTQFSRHMHALHSQILHPTCLYSPLQLLTRYMDANMSKNKSNKHLLCFHRFLEEKTAFFTHFEKKLNIDILDKIVTKMFLTKLFTLL